MHLRADAVNLRHAVALPILNHVDESLALGIVVVSGLKVIIIDKELEPYRIASSLTCQADDSTRIILAQMILPEEVGFLISIATTGFQL